MFRKMNFVIILLVLVYPKSILGQSSVTETATVEAMNVTVVTESSTLEPQNPTVELQNSTIEPQNSTVGPQNSTVSPQNATEGSQIVIPQVTVSEQNSTTITQNAFNAVSDAFEFNEIVPKYFPVAPRSLANITFKGVLDANLGKELSPNLVKNPPNVNWNGSPDQYYCLLMADLDLPSRPKPTLAEFLHWLVVNIKGANLTSGDTVARYIGAGPPRNSGLHRYVLLVFQQPTELVFNLTRLNNTSVYKRPGFSVTDFANRYDLGDPFAGNIFLSRYDSYVPALYKQLGISAAIGVQPLSLLISVLVWMLLFRLRI